MTENNDITKCIAAFDAIKIICLEQQIILGKILAKQMNINESDILDAIKNTSIEIMNRNSL